MSAARAYEKIAEVILAEIDAGAAPWVKPWSVNDIGEPVNHKTGRPYDGCNWVVLNIVARNRDYSTNRWLTYLQAKELGGQVRKGSKGVSCIKYGMGQKKPESPADEPVFYPYVTTFTVFNLDQIDGLTQPDRSPHAAPALKEPAAIVQAMPNPPVIRTLGNAAWYRRSDDTVNVPPLKSFDSESHYWATMFHELAHATGHESRLNRPASRGEMHAYSAEELCAEFAASFLCAVSGIATDDVTKQSAAYLAHWKKAITDSPREMVSAIGRAKKAADYITGKTAD